MKRILTAAVLIPVVLAGVFAGAYWLLAIVSAVALLMYIEYSQILLIPMPGRLLGIAAGLVLLAIPPERVFLLLLLLALTALAWLMSAADLRAGFGASAAMFLGVMYIFGAMKTGYLLGLRSPWWLLTALMINWIGDTGAYYVGRRFGKHKLAPRVSPGKSWEGAAASMLFSTVFYLAAAPRVLPVAVATAGLLGLLGNCAGQMGDLAESALKRAMGVKDSGTLLPGHGGMLDRVDSALFTLPTIYALTQWMGL